ncbi:DUF1542 domain-containing protein [Catenovulum sp. 2E275]|uniref:DUF1542 domain-containing protein n=1 Tax=Catenovulum sp. 2E275 TaxID=2980497 RepID=UPI0021D18879|nr:DUF1542 domain-containing protein [Catenovulum sp. 2E275]MCU4677009.1 DUF1542 domain-containing protein [Catenovulum sp. 2E275]
MLSSVQLSQNSITLLQRRGLDQTQINQFSHIVNQAAQHEQGYADYLAHLNSSELKLVQQANALASSINPANLSQEGTINLFKQPDKSDVVDLNNDGLVEVGIGKTIVFPPVNAPDYVKAAWQQATQGLSESESVRLTLQMHIAIYGVQMDGMQKQHHLPATEQWNEANTQALFDELYSNLDFRVNLEGWSQYNLMLKDFYSVFEEQLAKGREQSSNTANYSDKKSNKSPDSTSQTHEVLQLLLDAKLGINREKLKELDEKIAAISQDENLTAEQKQNLINALEKQKEAILEQAQQRLMEQENQLF